VIRGLVAAKLFPRPARKSTGREPWLRCRRVRWAANYKRESRRG
jgi:hypothetical protein